MRFLRYLVVLISCLVLFPSLSQGKDGEKKYEIKIKINGLPDTTFYLANFYAKNQYYKDTARSDKKGLMVFSGEEELEEGMYSLVLGDRKIMDLFVIEKFMSFETDTIETVRSMKIKGSKENSLFYEYMNYLKEKEIAAGPIQKELKDEDEEVVKEAREKLGVIDTDVTAYVKNFIEVNSDYFVSKFLNGMREVEIPEAPKDEEGNITDSLFQYRYFREHFFDNIDFSDARYLRTPVYHQKLSAWITKYTYQVPDSLYSAIDFVVNKSRANEELFRYTVSWITNNYETSKIMGMDAIFVHMAENYYMTDEVDWIDSTKKSKIDKRYKTLKPLLIGKIAPNIVLQDTTEVIWHNLHKLEAEYTLVYIWSPTCGHCKKITPKMHDLYLKFQDHGFKVYAVGTEFKNKEWKKYIRDHNLTWLNVSDNEDNPNNIKDYPLNFRTNYDVFSTPKIYLLDKDKKIVAKKIEHVQLDEFLSRAFDMEPESAKEKQNEKENENEDESKDNEEKGKPSK